MPFVTENNNVISFAEFQDVVNKDARLFDANEGLSDDIVEAQLVRATERILSKLRSSAWWQGYYVNRSQGTVLKTLADIPALDVNRIIGRQNDFTDLCVYTALAEYILPSVADFGKEDNAERQKMGYYTQKADALFGELISAGDWYDFDDSGTIASNEKQPGQYNLKRVMRQEILDYINSLALGGFLLSTEYPFEESGTPLYEKNLKKIYVDMPAKTNEPIIQALNGLNINTQLTTIRMYFSCDAKTLPSNYEALVDDLIAAKNISTIDGLFRREAEVTTEIKSDILVTTIEIRFTKS